MKRPASKSFGTVTLYIRFLIALVAITWMSVLPQRLSKAWYVYPASEHLKCCQVGHLDANAYPIFDSQIKIKSDALPLQYTEDGLEFTDGTELKADFIVFATGFVGSMKVAIHDLLGSDVAERIEDFWGVNEEGEIKGAFIPSGREFRTP